MNVLRILFIWRLFMKEKYDTAELEIIQVDNTDVISTSTSCVENTWLPDVDI